MKGMRRKQEKDLTVACKTSIWRLASSGCCLGFEKDLHGCCTNSWGQIQHMSQLPQASGFGLGHSAFL